MSELTDYPCPTWCTTDHDEYDFHASERAEGCAPEFYFWRVRAVRYAHDRRDRIQVAAAGVLTVPADDTDMLADLIDRLADATPEQHRELAAAIREAATRLAVNRSDKENGDA